MASNTKRRSPPPASPFPTKDAGTGLPIGYARVSTEDQKLNLQRDALARAGWHRTFEDRVSGPRMRFLRPVEVGNEVSCYCTLERTGDMSVAVKIETWIRDRTGSDAEKVTEGVFTYVALDENSKPRTAAPGEP